MKHTLALVVIVLGLVGCSMPQEEKENIAAVTCSIMSETRNMDAAIRVEKMNDARDKIDGEPFLRGDAAIKEAFDWGLCQELVLNETYDERLKSLKDAERERKEAIQERERLAWEAGAEDRKIAAEKKRLEEDKRRAEIMEEIDFDLYVYKVGAFGSPETVTKVIQSFGDNGFPAFAKPNESNKTLTTVLVGPFVSKDDIRTNQTVLNKIAGITMGEIITWNP